MHGRIVGEVKGADGAWLADIHHPDHLSNILLIAEDLRFTRGYQNPDARTRITDLQGDTSSVKVGSEVVVSMAVQREHTGERQWVGYYGYDGRRSGTEVVEQSQIVAAIAGEWGLRRSQAE